MSGVYFQDEWSTIYHGDCREVLPSLPVDSLASCVTDPPYGLTANKKGGSGLASVNLASPYGRSRIGTGNGPGGFMGMKWDGGVPGAEVWAEIYRALKPGAFLLAFGGTRTYHRLACAIEDAGFEIRDCLMWLYGQGFPKSLNLGNGYGTALKPAWEPIIVAMKPCEGTFAQNALKHGVAGLAIDAGRIGDRWPANVILNEAAAEELDRQNGILTSGSKLPHHVHHVEGGINAFGSGKGGGILRKVGHVENFPGDSGGASRFFYCAKADPSERETGNNHPTVKPLDLMRYLCKLVLPPSKATLLDPFMGSGSTLVAAKRVGYRAIGIETEERYCEIAARRLSQGMLDLPTEKPAPEALAPVTQDSLFEQEPGREATPLMG